MSALRNPSPRDIRDLMREGAYYAPAPEILVVYLAKHNVSGTALALWTLYWGEGVRNHQWMVEIPVSAVAARLGKSVDTIDRAHTKLIELGMIRRLRSRNPMDPRQEAVAITELLIPKPVQEQFFTAPKRKPPTTKPYEPEPIKRAQDTPERIDPAEAARAWEAFCAEDQARWAKILPLKGKMTTEEKLRLAQAHGQRDPDKVVFATNTALSSIERTLITDTLTWLRDNAPTQPPSATPMPEHKPVRKRPRALSALQHIELGRRIQPYVDLQNRHDRLQECLWSVLHGCYADKPIPWAINAVVKTLASNPDNWKRPFSMPVGWKWGGPA